MKKKGITHALILIYSNKRSTSASVLPTYIDTPW